MAQKEVAMANIDEARDAVWDEYLFTRDDDEDDMQFHWLPDEFRRAVAPDLCDFRGPEFLPLSRQLDSLAEIDRSLRVPLGMRTRAMERAIRAIRDDDPNAFDDELDRVVAQVDSPGVRIELAQAVIALREQGHISAGLAAMAVFELDAEVSAFFVSSVEASLYGAVEAKR
jgi:hypothetical protein